MIDNFALGLTHGLMLLAAWRLLSRPDLERRCRAARRRARLVRPSGRRASATMRDLVLVAFLAALLLLGLKRPFLFVLAYIYVDIVSPQRLSYSLLNSIPISMIVAALAIGGWLVADKKELRFAPRQGLILVLLALRHLTTALRRLPGRGAGRNGTGCGRRCSSRSSCRSRCAPGCGSRRCCCSSSCRRRRSSSSAGSRRSLAAAATACST